MNLTRLTRNRNTNGAPAPDPSLATDVTRVRSVTERHEVRALGVHPGGSGGLPQVRPRAIERIVVHMTTITFDPATTSTSTRSAHGPAPAGRDRFVDLVRAGCIAVVVGWHWMLTTIDWRSDGPHVGNPIPDIPFGWLITWFVQPMPLFFLVGGHLHRRSLERHTGSTGAWIAGRLRGLLVPVLPLLGGFAAVYAGISVFWPGHGIERALILMISPLWFLAVYVFCVAAAPACMAAHRRNRALVPAALIGVTVVLDVLRFGSGTTGWWSLLTMLTVWGMVHHLGLVAWDVVQNSKIRARTTMICGFAAMALLVVAGPYAAAMVGVQGADSNFSPATLVVLALGVAHLGMAATLRPAAERLIEASPRLVDATLRLNRNAMRVFAWHLPAWGVAFVLLSTADFPIPPEPTALWWATRPAWFLAPVAVLLAPRLVRGLRTKISG